MTLLTFNSISIDLISLCIAYFMSIILCSSSSFTNRATTRYKLQTNRIRYMYSYAETSPLKHMQSANSFHLSAKLLTVFRSLFSTSRFACSCNSKQLFVPHRVHWCVLLSKCTTIVCKLRSHRYMNIMSLLQCFQQQSVHANIPEVYGFNLCCAPCSFDPFTCPVGDWHGMEHKHLPRRSTRSIPATT